MPKEFWINLPVADIDRARAFFEALDFDVDAANISAQMMAMRLGEKRLVVMLIADATFARAAGADVADTRRGAEVMISFDAENRAEVDALPDRVTAAGGTVFTPPTEIDGWMYGAGFADPDGHRWNILHMDPARRATLT